MRHDTFCRLLHLTWNGIGLIINFRWQPFCVVFIGPIVIVQMHTYTNTYTYACMHILLYIHTNVCIQTYMDAYIIYMHTYIYSSHAHTLYTYIYMQKSCMHLMHTNAYKCMLRLHKDVHCLNWTESMCWITNNRKVTNRMQWHAFTKISVVGIKGATLKG